MLATISNVKCDRDDADIDIAYRMCCITVGTSPSFKVGTSPSFMAAWIENQVGKDKLQGGRKRG